ncbi:MAG TPA: XdhC family protein [Acidothermaceae bacterium]|jgi:xanthine dehydrogenase accessory factor|nr:XdhC family protein [Acidothermaceae bacterium]
MHEVLDSTASWYREGLPFALVTVVKVFGSAPRLPGIAMAVGANGDVIGSVSGGCIEGAVYEEALLTLENGTPAKRSYGVTDDDAFAVGLTCGGDIDVFIERVDAKSHPDFLAVVAAVASGDPIGVATTIEGAGVGHHVVVGAGSANGGDPVVEAARSMLAQGRTGQVTCATADGDCVVFVESFCAPPRLIVFGATDFARALVAAGALLGYHTTVCDARAVFATPTRFPEADEVVVDQPYRYLESTKVDERTVLCVLTHDPKFDVPLLQVALRSEAGYIGALGSRRTHEDRLQRLREAGLTEAELARLRSPIGLDLGASNPQETAVSILAEVIAARNAATARPLTATSGPIHS